LNLCYIDYYSQTHQEDGQHASQPETGQPSSGASWSYPVQGQSYQDFDHLSLISFSPSPDWEYLQQSPQPMVLEDTVQNDASLAPFNPQPAVKTRRKSSAEVKEYFLAGLDNYARGVQLKYCSATLAFKSYVSDDGRLHVRGQELRASLPHGVQMRVDQALAARRVEIIRRTSMDVGKFMVTLEPYANGLSFQECGHHTGLKWNASTYFTPEGTYTQGQATNRKPAAGPTE
jgi:hypothetical protein